MARARSTKRHSRRLNTLQEKGIAVCTLGAGMLLIPLFTGKSPVVVAITNGLRPVGWLALVAGTALLLLHRFIKSKQQTQPDLQSQSLPKAPKLVRDAGDDIASNARDTASAATEVPVPATWWSSDVFAAIEWRRFEAVCERLFGQAGFETKSQSHGADGGVDIWLHCLNADGPVAVVQCKHWQDKAIGVKELREFFGVMASHKLKRGTYATTSTYTADAQLFARDNGINALDGAGLLALIAKRSPEQQQELLAVAYEGEYWRPTCASCGTKMVKRTPSKGGANFWGCSGYPKCKSRMQMVLALR